MGSEVPVEVPTLEGMRVEAATVVKWLKKEGDVVKRGDPILLVEFPKADLEVPSPATGRLTKVLAKEGKMVRVHDRVATIET